MANRYSNISTSQFDPLSLQEVLSVPLYKQGQYNQLEADRIKQAEMFKVDPLDVHKDLASQLNRDYMSKVDELANYQTKTGDIQGAKSKLLDLQREYKKLTDPMGNVSKINNANKAFQDEQTRFLESASKQYGSARALELWNQHKQNYKGFNDKGDITNINPKGIVANQDFMKDVKEFHDLMGKTTSSVAGSGYKIVERPEGLVMVNSSGKTVSNSNFEQLKNAEKALKSKWIEPTGEGTLYNIEAGKDSKEFKNYFKNTILSQRESGISKESDTSASFIGSTGKDKNTPSGDLEGVNVEAKPAYNNAEMLAGLTGLSTNINPGSMMSTGAALHPDASPTNKLKMKEQIYTSPEYNRLKQQLIRTNKSLSGLNIKDKRVDDAALKYLKENKEGAVQNRYIDPNSSKVGRLFASKELSGKEGKDKASNLIMERAQQGAYEVRDINGELIPADELGKYNFTYSGDMTAKSQIGNIFSNPLQNIGARRGLLYDPETKTSKKVYVSRGADDFETPQFKGMKVISEITKFTDSQPGIYHRLTVPDFEKHGISNFEVKYNKNSDTYNVSYKDNDGTNVDESPMTDSQFQEYILNSQMN